MIRTETKYSKTGLLMAQRYEKCCARKCHHVSNDKYYGKPFLFEPFQRENIWRPIFACGTKTENGFERRFKRAIIGLPSGYGKTELAAALVLVVATMEPIHNGQYGVVASSTDQVRNIFEKIGTMIKLDDDWAHQWQILKDVIVHKETGAKIMVLPNKASALESWHFNVLIFDELHVYKDSGVWDAGVKGQKVLKNPLAIGITTAADMREGFLWDTLQICGNDPSMYVYWLGLDDHDNIDDPKAWEKMLVASWVTMDSIEDLRHAATTARSFERYTANRFPMSKSQRSVFNADDIEQAKNRKVKFDFSKPYTVGIDGAISRDTFAVVAYQKQGEKDVFAEWTWDEPDESGYYPMLEIADVITELAKKDVLIACDPARMVLMSQFLEKERGVEMFAVAQNDRNMCAASELFRASVKKGNACFSNTPVLADHAANCIEEEKKAYGFRFTSTGSGANKLKIDAAIAGAIAMYAANELQPRPDYSDSVFSFDL